MNRLVLASYGHEGNWGHKAGTWSYVDPVLRESTSTGSDRLLVNIIATRPTALCTAEPFSKGPASVITHDESSALFKRIVRDTEARPPKHGSCHGTELLLYVHELGQVLTYLVASPTAKKNLMPTVKEAGAFSARALMLSSNRIVTSMYRFDAPIIKKTDLYWDGGPHGFKNEVNAFSHPETIDSAVVRRAKQTIESWKASLPSDRAEIRQLLEDTINMAWDG